jgi:acetyl esterase/lipase
MSKISSRIRLLLLPIALNLAASGISRSAAELPQIPSGIDRFLGIENLPLWPRAAPDARGTAPADIPSLTLMRPSFDRINGTAVIVAPGGAYAGLAFNLEGRQVADWFTARGVTAFVLSYRLGKQYPYPIPLNDAQRAIRFVRANAARWGVSADKIGMIGFSAGGHLTAMAGTAFHAANDTAGDPIDRASDRPDFVVLGYPALDAFEIGADGTSAYCRWTQIPNCDAKAYSQYVPYKLVRADSSPAFLYHTTEDNTSPLNSVRFYQALIESKIPAELHIFGRGAHGSGLGNGDPNLDHWPMLLEGWLRKEGFLDLPSKTLVPTAKEDETLSLQASVGAVLANPRAAALVKKVTGRDFPNDSYRKVLDTLSLALVLVNDFNITDQQLKDLDKALRSLDAR